jgi:hypothetical protein
MTRPRVGLYPNERMKKMEGHDLPANTDILNGDTFWAFISWARYVAFADIFREQYEASLDLPDEPSEERSFPPYTPLLSPGRSARLQKDAAFAYYHSSLMPVIEGWKELALVDEKIDALLLHEDGYYASLRRYRNSTFHYQREFFGPKQSEWYAKGQKMVIWVILLHGEFSRVYREIVDGYPTGKHWTQRHRSWLAGQTFQEHAHGIVFQDYLETVWTTQQRRDALIDRISAMVGSWSLGPLVEALRGLRGIDMISAATFIASTGDLSRFESPRLLMGYLGLVPSEHSSGGTIRRGGITKTGNREARRMLIEAAWSYQYPARIAKEKAEILVRLLKNIRDIAWKAQTRLCTRYRSMVARGKKPTVVVAAIARELAGFIWAIGQEVRCSNLSVVGD